MDLKDAGYPKIPRVTKLIQRMSRHESERILESAFVGVIFEQHLGKNRTCNRLRGCFLVGLWT